MIIMRLVIKPSPLRRGSGPANCGRDWRRDAIYPYHRIMALPRPKRFRDLNQSAKHIVDLATGSAKWPDPNEGADSSPKCNKVA
jgi:hypothetical protein